MEITEGKFMLINIEDNFWVIAKFIKGRPKEFLDYRGRHVSKIEDAAKYASERTAFLVCRSRHECSNFQPLYIQATYSY